MITKIYPDNPDYRVVDRVVAALRAGELIIYPTGIGYALGCSALKQQAVENLYRLKKSNLRKQRFAIMCPSLSDAAKYSRIDNEAFNYIKQHLRESVTYILSPLSSLPKLLKSSKEIGIRLSQNPITTLILESLSEPLITASLPLRREDVAYVTNPELIDEEYGHQVYTVIDGGKAPGLKSKVVRLQGELWEVIRQEEPIFVDL